MIILKLGHPISYNEVIDKSVFNSLDLAGFARQVVYVYCLLADDA